MTDNNATPPPPPEQPAAGQPVGGQPVAAAPMADSEAKTYLVIAHIGVIITGFLAPLVIWLIGKDRSAKIDAEAKEALNFGILLSITYVVAFILTFVLIGVLVYIAAFILSLIFCIQAAIKANNGEPYRYPLNLRLVK